LDNLLFKVAVSTIYSFLASGKLQNIREEVLLPFIKVTFLPVDWSMQARGQYLAYEEI
jgi:hypothetical protein